MRGEAVGPGLDQEHRDVLRGGGMELAPAPVGWGCCGLVGEKMVGAECCGAGQGFESWESGGVGRSPSS